MADHPPTNREMPLEPAAKALARYAWMSAWLDRKWVHRRTNRFRRLIDNPRSYYFRRRGTVFSEDVDVVVQALMERSGAEFDEEYGAVEAAFLERFASDGRSFPDNWAVGRRGARMLYRLVRMTGPSTVLEVGVADGGSSFPILAAMDRNDHGRLVSVDVTQDVGSTVRGHPRWDLRVVEAATSWKQLERIADDLGTVGLYFHDAGHGYYHQMRDHLAVRRSLAPGSLFVSDDVEWSWAFADLTERLAVRPAYLAEGGTIVGAFRWPG